MSERDNKHSKLEHLIKQIRDGTNREVLKAVNTLHEFGWLTDGTLRHADLFEADLRGADLRGVYLAETNLSNADLSDADLSGANLIRVNLRGAHLVRADLTEADLTNAILRESYLIGTDLSKARLNRTNLFRADLRGANLSNSELTGAILGEVFFGETILGGVDLSKTKELDLIQHFGPSTIDIATFYKSKGEIPEVFLRGCGVPQEFIEFTRGLFGEKAIQFHNGFISYSHKDVVFPHKLKQALYHHGVNCWIDTEDLKGGDFWADVINQAIHHHEKLIVCCSENSLHSIGVDREVNTALRIEERIYQETKEKVSVIV